MSIVRSKLDYGSVVYNSAYKNLKSILDPINNTAARLICGAFKTSSISSIICEANLTTLENRRQALSLNYALATIPSQNKPTKVLMQSSRFLHALQKNPNKPQPLNIRIQKLFEELELDLPLLLERRQIQTPPWLMKIPVQVEIADVSTTKSQKNKVKKI